MEYRKLIANLPVRVIKELVFEIICGPARVGFEILFCCVI